MKIHYSAFLALTMISCGASNNDSPGAQSADAAVVDATPLPDAAPLPDAEPTVPVYAELWYAVDDRLIHIALDDSSGAVQALNQSTVSDLAVGQNCLTMLEDGSLLGARLNRDYTLIDRTQLYHIAEPPRDGSSVTPTLLGFMPDSIMLEGLYTDCDGRLYAMDTGVNVGSSVGNRLLRFTGDVLAGDLAFEVVSDLATANVADIDDMGPAIIDNEISDNPGLAIDSGRIYSFDYETGVGTIAGTGGSWGIHALGKELFTDDVARLFVLSSVADLREMDPVSYELFGVLITGPVDVEGNPGWSGLAGPLTECDSGFVID
ncbi:MAG: hypothetical protein GY811_20760 [Myxococcales bacterium]|nr:hypothetical protein [Myxococcales bacterium]